MNISMNEGFIAINERLGNIEKDRKILKPLAKPEDLDPSDERLNELRKCKNCEDTLQLLPPKRSMKVI